MSEDNEFSLKQLEFLTRLDKLNSDTLVRQIDSRRLLLKLWKRKLCELREYRLNPDKIEIDVKRWEETIKTDEAQINIRIKVLSMRGLKVT